MRRARLLLLPILTLACIAAPRSSAQAAQSPVPAAISTTTNVSLGNSSIALTGPWKFAPGDSTHANGSFLWASPTFDDAAWANMDLHSQGGLDAYYGNPGYIQGWTAKGFPNLAGFAWYRLRIHVNNATGPLWLKMPDHFDDGYQVFANGRYAGQFGDFSSKRVVCYRSRPAIFPLPPSDGQGNILLAIRFYMEPTIVATGLTGPTGGMHQAPVMGLHAPVALILAQANAGRILDFIVPDFLALLAFLAALGAFRIWLLDRPRSTYLWLSLAFVFTAAATVGLMVGLFSNALGQDATNYTMITFGIFGLTCWIFFWRRWFDLPRNRWLEFLIGALVAARILTEFLDFINFSPQNAMHAFFLFAEIRAGLDAALGAMLFLALVQGARNDRIAALAAMPPIVLLTISLFSAQLISWYGVRTAFFPFGVRVGIDDIAEFLLILVAGVLVARRFLNSQVNQRLERQAVEQELEQARELQQHVLVPEPVTSSLFTVETAYHPARSVGGDFFQVIPHADGSLLIVVGDVSGKGMAAAMLVAVLVGAIRTRADETSDPAAILHCLNDRLLGRSDGHFATCIAAHLRPGGAMRIANAGHIPPYRNGVAVDLEGSIPLGIISGAEYDVHTIQLDQADHLTFLTDGVLEARNAAGQLLGFAELARISSLPPEAIAQAAVAHGQEDDITVVSVRLCPTAAVREFRALQVCEANLGIVS